MFGTIVNTVAVIAGSIVGMTIRRGLSDRIKRIIFQGIGLMTLFIGVQMALKTSNLVILFFSILIGAIIGELINMENHLDRFGELFKNRFRSGDQKFVEGLITAFLIFCVGSMTIVGAIEDGLNGNPSILIAKSVLDGFVSVSLASVFGVGVLFSAVPLLIFQGGITLRQFILEISSQRAL